MASLVIENIEPAAGVSPDVSAFWLFWDLLPDPEWTVSVGDVLAITEGTRAVAYLTVESVTEDDRT